MRNKRTEIVRISYKFLELLRFPDETMKELFRNITGTLVYKL